MEWWQQKTAKLDMRRYQEAQARQDSLTKPPGSLGRLEDLAARLAAMQAVVYPRVDQVWISVFAADHGITDEGVSAFPQAVTGQMIRNFVAGGAAISVLARELGAHLEVIDMGTISSAEPAQGVRDCRIAAGTQNFADREAMSEAQCRAALQAGQACAQRVFASRAQLFIPGDMGIGNTTSATALACALLNLPAEDLAGPGTGLNQQQISHKAKVINAALARHALGGTDPLRVLQTVGGFEIAAMTGAMLACAQKGITILVDGFIATSAALVAKAFNPQVCDWMLFAHCSAEPGHRRLLDAIPARPLLDLKMRLGEGSGAAVAVPLLRLACRLHRDMATFDQAGVSQV